MNFGSKATPLIRTQKGVASASCQIFGNCAVFTLTLAPETTEDFPQEVGDFILEEASRLGLAHVIIINAHNSINGPFDVSKVVEPLKEAALDVLKKASNLKASSFEVGAAKVVPKEFSFEDGMGPGGICAVVIRVGEQTCSYITIDGNNMVKGLREGIIEEVKKLGFHDGEVITTDTHLMSAIPLTRRGYYPVGETIPHQLLISHIKNTVIEANKEMRKSDFSCRVVEIDDVRVIGEKSLLNLSLLIDSTMKYVKILVPLTFLPATIVSLIPFFVL